jgi:hypothetical protein
MERGGEAGELAPKHENLTPPMLECTFYISQNYIIFRGRAYAPSHRPLPAPTPSAQAFRFLFVYD